MYCQYMFDELTKYSQRLKNSKEAPPKISGPTFREAVYNKTEITFKIKVLHLDLPILLSYLYLDLVEAP